MGKPTIYIGENKDADQLRGNREADQRLCFRYSDSTIPLLLKSEISSFQLFSVLVQAGLCRSCSETTLLVFPRGGSFGLYSHKCWIESPSKMMAIARHGHFCSANCLPMKQTKLIVKFFHLTDHLTPMSRIMRKRDFCLCENKGADQLRGNREADQRLCFRYTDSTISLLLKSEISSF